MYHAGASFMIKLKAQKAGKEKRELWQRAERSE